MVLGLGRTAKERTVVVYTVSAVSGVLSEKLRADVGEKFSDSCQTTMFITVLARAYYLSSILKLKETGLRRSVPETFSRDFAQSHSRYVGRVAQSV